MARVFGGQPPPAAAAAAPGAPAGSEASVKALLDSAAAAYARASEELRRLGELLQQLRSPGAR